MINKALNAIPFRRVQPRLGGKLVTESSDIGPEDAKYLLSLNPTNNRPITRGHVKTLARLMRLGLWQQDFPEGLSFSVSGRLLNGHHRLHAVVATGTTQRFRITWNCPEQDGALSLPFDTCLLKRSVSHSTGLDKQAAAVVGVLIRVCLSQQSPGSRAVLAAHALALHTVLEPSITAIERATNAKKRGLSAAPLRAAVILRHALASAEGKSAIENAYALLVMMRTSEMPPSVGRVLNELIGRPAAKGDDMRLFGVGWSAFDPGGFSRRRVVVPPASECMSIAREAVYAVWPEGRNMTGENAT